MLTNLDCNSEFDFDSASTTQTAHPRNGDGGKANRFVSAPSGIPKKADFREKRSHEDFKVDAAHYAGYNAYDKHKIIMAEYMKYYNCDPIKISHEFHSSHSKSLYEVLKENHRFLWDDDENAKEELKNHWSKRIAKKYYDKLHKEYCIVDLSKFREGKVGMRWRTSAEVIVGSGQFVCADKSCTSRKDLVSWEVSFAYKEEGETKIALVKARLCPDCSIKLNWKHKKKLAKSSKSDERHLDRKKHQKKTKPSSLERKELVSEDRKKALESENEESTPKQNQNGKEIWRRKREEADCQSAPNEREEREQEFDAYFKDLLL